MCQCACVVAYRLWLTRYGLHAVAYTLWLTLCGLHGVSYTLCPTRCGLHGVAYTLCGAYGVWMRHTNLHPFDGRRPSAVDVLFGNWALSDDGSSASSTDMVRWPHDNLCAC